MNYKAESETGLVKLSSGDTGIHFRNDLSDEMMSENRVLMNGSGVAAGDINGDGHVDLYFTRIDGPNQLYVNMGGFRFRDITEEAGVAHTDHYSTGAVFADVNGNSHLDLLVTSVEGENALYLNDGTGKFEFSENSGLESSKGSMTMALADVNGNGYLDLYVVNYRETNVLDLFDAQKLTWENTIKDGELIPPFDEYFTILNRGEGFPPERHEIGRRDELYLNRGDGTFEKANPDERFFASDGSPLGLYPDWGLSAKFQDLNGNGFPDLYVNNDFWTPDRVWINQGNGTFRAIDSLAIRNSSFYSMTADFSDINRNGFTDIFAVEMLNKNHSDRLRTRLPVEPMPLLNGEYHLRPRYNRNSLYLNRGDHTYAEISHYSGLEASEWSWATRFIDLDLDGYEDVIIANGFAHDFQNLDAQQTRLERLIETQGSFTIPYIDEFPPLRQQNRIFRNNGNLKFTDVSSEWGFEDLDISLGMAVADLNNDGFLDIVLSRMNDEPAIYKNRSEGARIAIRLKGTAPNTQAVTAKVELHGGPADHQTKQVVSGGDYLSGSDPLMVFAAHPEHSHALTITWPNGTYSRIENLSPNRIYEIDQSAIAPQKAGSDQTPVTLASGEANDEGLQSFFKDVTESLGHNHYEDEFDDFRVQPLLPKKISQLGPGLGWLDLTGDGREELVIGSGKGGNTGVFEVDEDGQFSMSGSELSEIQADGDYAGLAGWEQDGRTHLVIGLANYEMGNSRAPSALHYQVENGRIAEVDSLPGVLSTTGPLAAADYNGDGAPDLFIGGRFLPGQYPADATSRLFRNLDGKLVPDRENSAVFESLGLVTGAVFVDYNLSGEQDLIVATEWGAVRLFENNGGIFTEKTTEAGLNQYNGLWQGIATGDFNGDGYPDVVVTNFGENSPYRVNPPEQPLRIFYGDFNLNRRMDVIESYYDEGSGGYVPSRKMTEYEHIQDILGHVRTHKEFSELTVPEMLRRSVDRIPFKEVNTLQHIVFINNEGAGFSAQPLPAEAQFSAGFYAGVADFDNDGHEDIFMSQNFFGVADPQRKPRMDAGRGLWLKGDGNGNFEPVPGQLSGVKIYGEQRGAALGDYNGDGRVDLAVSQNSAETRLFENQTEKRGLRVSLSGPSSNQTGTGSGIRLVYEDEERGPTRYVQAGSGYWSQNSSVQVLGFERWPIAIEVIWYDGASQTVDFKEGQMEYVVVHPGLN
ncbi:MAG: FG-GAP-like repeat-containing protein [Balneolaceae bacterium]